MVTSCGSRIKINSCKKSMAYFNSDNLDLKMNDIMNKLINNDNQS
jgi:hypothetical protein